MKISKDRLVDAAGIAGIGLIWYGVRLWSPPASWVAVGSILLVLSIVGAIRR